MDNDVLLETLTVDKMYRIAYKNGKITKLVMVLQLLTRYNSSYFARESGQQKLALPARVRQRSIIRSFAHFKIITFQLVPCLRRRELLQKDSDLLFLIN